LDTSRGRSKPTLLYAISGTVYAIIVLLSACSPTIDKPSPRIEIKTAEKYRVDARQYLETNRYKDATAAANSGLSLDSTDVELHNIVATCFAAEGRYTLAIESLENTLRLQPTFVTGLLNLGGIYTKLGQNERAANYLYRARELNPNNSGIRRRLGEVYLINSQYAQATHEFAAALQLFPDDATLLYYLGQSLEGELRNEEALQSLQRATLVDIGFTDAFYRLGVLARKLGREALARKALQQFKHLRSIGTGKVEVHKQVERLRAAILNAPEEAQHHYNLGLLFARNGYFAEAESKFDRAISLQGGDSKSLNSLARDLAELKQPGVALRYVEAALEQDPTYVPALLTAGQVSGQLQRYQHAVAYFEQVVSIRPKVSEGWYFLALSLSSLGQKDEAVAAFKHCVEVGQPQDRFSIKAMQLLSEIDAQLPSQY